MYTERTVDGMGNYCTKERDQLCHRRGGFTLMELMVYIAILGIVVLVAGQAYSGSAKSRIRTQSMLKASEVAENVASIFKTDVAQTGAKSSMETHASGGNSDTFGEVNTDVYIDPDNLSSFELTTAGNYSDLKVRRIRYDEAGHYQAVEEVHWFVDGTTLKRSCSTVSGTADAETCGDDAEPTEMATDVTQFVVLPAVPWHNDDAAEGEDEYLMFPDVTGEFKFVSRSDASKNILPLVAGDAGSSVVLSNFAYNTQSDPEEPVTKNFNEVYAFKKSAPDASWQNLCESYPIHLDANTTYELSFGVAPADGTDKALMSFVPNRDHMAVGFRDKNGNKIAGLHDFSFFPPLDTTKIGGVAPKDIERKMRFAVGSENKDVCIAFVFSYYSPSAPFAHVSISNLKLRVAESEGYAFDESVTSVDDKYKRYVKALQLQLKVARNGESGTVKLMVPIPSNGPTD